MCIECYGKMSIFTSFISLTLVFLSVAGIVKGETKFSFAATACRLLGEKLTVSSPWAVDPILFEPIQRGRLTVWTGVSTLATSDSKCVPGQSEDSSFQKTNELILDFSNFANKLEWTFYDQTSGVTYTGTSINLHENGKFKVTVLDKQMDSYFNCNIVDKVELLNDGRKSSIQTHCLGCDKSIVALIDVQVEEMFRSRLNKQIEDNLYWHLTQLLSSQHFSHPLILENNLD